MSERASGVSGVSGVLHSHPHSHFHLHFHFHSHSHSHSTPPFPTCAKQGFRKTQWLQVCGLHVFVQVRQTSLFPSKGGKSFPAVLHEASCAIYFCLPPGPFPGGTLWLKKKKETGGRGMTSNEALLPSLRRNGKPLCSRRACLCSGRT